MTALIGALYIALTAACGALVAGLVHTRMTLLERTLVALVTAVIGESALTYGLSLAAGLNSGIVLSGPLVIAAAAAVASRSFGDPREPWMQSIADARDRWREKPPWVAVAAGAFATVVFALLFAHTIFSDAGALDAGYPTVWADWSQHLSTAASFAVGQNFPPQNPLLSGTPLLYPFLADYHSATLMTLGVSAGAALAVPSAVLSIPSAMLIVVVALRLGATLAAGIIAALICFLGGGIGFEAVFADACVHSGHAVTQCTLGYVATHPADVTGLVGGTLHDLPGVVAAQPRAYDGLPSGGGPAPFAGMEWYTPLLAWWLPQRTFVYGFAAAMTALLLILAAQREERRGWDAFAVAAALLGLLPLVHVQTLMAVALILIVVALRHRRREWFLLLGVAVALALPRLAQIALSAHGSSAFGNAYPWFKPGWYANAGTHANPAAHLDFTLGNVWPATAQAAEQLTTPSWWGFWTANLGVAVPLCVVVAVAAALALFPGEAGRGGRRITGVFPAPLLEFALASLLIFVLCNVVAVSSWEWDNTKLLAYWYLGVALLAGALATHWWHRWWRGVAAAGIVGTMLLTGVLVALRLLPTTPGAVATTNRTIEIASAQERALAATLQKRTSEDAVFLTFGRPNDPVLAIAGRPGVMGYYGWLWSYGVDFGTRYDDVRTMYLGCATSSQPCRVSQLLRQYHVSYVEVDDRLSDPGAVQSATNLQWWASQGLKVVARSEHITIYDVRTGI